MASLKTTLPSPFITDHPPWNGFNRDRFNEINPPSPFPPPLSRVDNTPPEARGRNKGAGRQRVVPLHRVFASLSRVPLDTLAETHSLRVPHFRFAGYFHRSNPFLCDTRPSRRGGMFSNHVPLHVVCQAFCGFLPREQCALASITLWLTFACVLGFSELFFPLLFFLSSYFSFRSSG